MADFDLNKFQDLFIQTSQEYLDNMKKNLAELMKNPQNKKAIDEVHLDAHSLKSQSIVMGYKSFGKVCNIIENIFRNYKDDKLTLTHEILKYLQNTAEILQKSLDKIKNEKTEIAMTQEIAQLEKVTGIKPDL